MPKRSPSREARIVDEIIVDAHEGSEQAMGWYYYLDDRMRFPFVARCIEARGISPLRTGETVTVTGMAAEDECEHEMFVQLRALDSARNDSVAVFGTPERTVAEIASPRRQGGLSL